MKSDMKNGSTGIQTITSGYCKQLYANKLENLEEIDTFLGIYKLTSLNYEQTNNK